MKKLTELADWQMNLVCVWEAYRRLGFTPDQITFVQQINPTVLMDEEPSHEILVALYLEKYADGVLPDFATTLGCFSQKQYTVSQLAELITEASDAYADATDEEALQLWQGWGTRMNFPENSPPLLAITLAIAKKNIQMPAVLEFLAEPGKDEFPLKKANLN